MNEALEQVKKRLEAMQKIEAVGFTDQNKAADYFREKEGILEELTKAVETISKDQDAQITALGGTLKGFRDELKTQATYPKELSKRELHFTLGKALVAAWISDQKSLAELSCIPNPKAENWLNPKHVSWDVSGWRISKAALGEPMGNLATNDQYLINPIYEREIMTEAVKKSVMMPLVRHRPMAGPSIYLPTRDKGGVQLHWLTAYGQQIKGTKPKGAERLELKAYTLAGYIPWYDEFEEDSFVDLGAMFVEEFIEAYGQEFDRQCLTADEDPFIGALASPDATRVTISGNTVNDLSWKDFRDAVFKVPAEERKDCCWFLNETVLNHIASIEDTNGRPIWRMPTEAMPGRLDLYPYYEVSLLPQFADIGKDTPFAVFMNPRRIQHGDRKGIEIKKFDATTESMEYGELFLRFRKRDGILLAKPKGNIVVLTTKV